MNRKRSDQGKPDQRRWGVTEDHHQSWGGPELAFAGSTLACVAAWGAMHHTLAPELVRPAIVTLLFLIAAAIAAFAWRNRKPAPDSVTYSDVAGALTLIGMFMASTVDPHELVRIVFEEWPSSRSQEPLDG